MSLRSLPILRDILCTTALAAFTVPAIASASWTYAGNHGTDWAALDSHYTVCGSGQQQSPVNIVGTQEDLSLPALQFQYQDYSTLTVKNNGHTIQVSQPDMGSTLIVDGHEYRLLQFHFHVASEHTIDGQEYPMEVHFVHIDDYGSLLVVAVLMDTGSNGLALPDYILADAPDEDNEVTVSTSHNPGDLLPSTITSKYLTYSGSLTTPPCREGVKWILATDPVTVSDYAVTTMEGIASVWSNSHLLDPALPENGRAAQDLNGDYNARALQALNGRTISRTGPAPADDDDDADD